MQLTCTEEVHEYGGPGRFLLSRSEDALPGLIEEYGGSVQLIYLDPPFGTGDTFHIRLSGGQKAEYAPVYADDLGRDAYLAWMRTILTGCHALLSGEGSLFLHIDYRMSAHLRLLLDEIFGASNFVNEIIWCYKSGGRSTNHFSRKHDTILFYRKSKRGYFNIEATGKPRGPEKRNHMKRAVAPDGRVSFSIRSGGKTYTYYEDTPIYPTDVWSDIEHLQQKDSERIGYATQKPEALLDRILLSASRPGDLVMDLFSGSGTTAAAAARLGRRFVAVDASPFALYALRARLLANADHLSLFRTDHALRLSYPPASDTAELDAVRLENGRIELRRARFDETHPLAYLALGYADEGCFYPRFATTKPKLPLLLNCGGDNGTVLHIADTLGRQAFIELCPEGTEHV